MTGRLRRSAPLLVSAAGAMIVALDGTVLLVAQPSLQRALAAGPAQVQWTSTGYLVAVAALLVLAGRLGDRYGHLRLLCVGLLGFGAASAGIALAPSVGWVIALRVVQGLFGALLQPATLAVLRASYPERELRRAVAVRTGAIAVAAGSGPVLGGVLVAHFGWRAVFWLNVPVVLAAVLLALAVRLPAPERPAPQPLDLTGAVLLAGTLALLVHALAGVPAHGWTTAPALLELAGVAVLAAALAVSQRRAAHPIVPSAVTRSVPVTASMTLLLLATAGLFGSLFTATFLLQGVLGLDPLATGLRVLPLTVLMVLGSPLASIALGRWGPRPTAVSGTLLVVLGVAGLARLPAGDAVGSTGACFALIGAGFAAVMVTATGTVVGDAPPEYAGAVGGLKQTATNIGPTLGIAVATSVGAAASAGPTLLVLAAITALGLLPAALLPGNRKAGMAQRPPGHEPEVLHVDNRHVHPRRTRDGV
ncbi:drug resistance transporter, EmrB/QacA subfamily [Streptomyces sp. Ag82_O1-12]|uniref:MFS transporter n=1 Tax=unclassified Streptomyces TaxID=2593676 RepID=UPI000BC6410D|nr:MULTISPECIES: MFS transporter [unclassified Streptomyces]SMQ19710.1 drug resistance transporter, EmrB/QacA subfamily [Streptomyces sp. Ag82_O1-12]SOD48751.1 drug resistance transporter, EmrB/QacA subfamily [Streptomyces sp. Ag82_G6-1]